MRQELAVTGIRVLDLICPTPMGGTLAIGGDQGSGINVLAMETMLRLCRRYSAQAAVKTASGEPFNESNVADWISKLGVASCVGTVSPAPTGEILVTADGQSIARILPFAVNRDGADSWAILRRSVMESGRLPAVDLGESSSRLADADPSCLAQTVKSLVADGNSALVEYLSQPFFVAESWTQKPGETTEHDDLLTRVRHLIAAAQNQ